MAWRRGQAPADVAAEKRTNRDVKGAKSRETAPNRRGCLYGGGPLINTAATTLERYQRAFAETLGAEQAFGFWKGRVALYAILNALGIGEGDEVILPGYTCVMAVNPIVYLGAKPIFVDIDPATYNLDPNLVERAITANTRLVIAQHTYGNPADMGALSDISRRKGLPIVEDCCLAFGSTYEGRSVGTFGIASYFSFQWNKPYTTGLGGMAVVNDAQLAGKIAAVRDAEAVRPSAREVGMLWAQHTVYRALIYPRTTALAQTAYRYLTRLGLVVGSSTCQEYTPTMARDFFKGMSATQARIGLRRIHQAHRYQAHRMRIAALYDRLLSERGWPVFKPTPGSDAVLVRYPVRVSDKQRALESAARHFVELGSWFECPLHPIETPMEAYGYHSGMCPHADRACVETVNLPTHYRAGAATARRSVEFLTTIGPATRAAARASV
jgi:perosamine synthetase